MGLKEKYDKLEWEYYDSTNCCNILKQWVENPFNKTVISTNFTGWSNERAEKNWHWKVGCKETKGFLPELNQP